MNAFPGREDVRLRALLAEVGEQLAEYQMNALPVFDGLVAADGRLFLGTRGGKVSCFAGR
jgi:hypothetical protein